MKSLRTSLVLACVLAILGLAAPASAAVAPANDLIRSATSIGALPFTETLDTTQAHGDGPRFCGNSGSVFYRFKPSVDTRVQVATLGSDYDTVLTVLQGPLNDLRLVRCRDDSGFGVQSVVRFTAEAGRRYFIEVSSCCGSGRTGGGELVFTAQQLPLGELTVDFAITDATIDTVSGDVTIAGTLGCSHPAEILFFGRLRQRRSDQFIASASFGGELMYCSGGVASWSIDRIEPESGISFVAGDARLRFSVQAFDGGTFATIADDVSEVIALTE